MLRLRCQRRPTFRLQLLPNQVLLFPVTACLFYSKRLFYINGLLSSKEVSAVFKLVFVYGLSRGHFRNIADIETGINMIALWGYRSISVLFADHEDAAPGCSECDPGTYEDDLRYIKDLSSGLSDLPIIYVRINKYRRYGQDRDRDHSASEEYIAHGSLAEYKTVRREDDDYRTAEAEE